MPTLIPYLFKLSVSLAVVYLFYQLVLRKLTFYNWNRWYLSGYTLLSFLIPFINVTAVLKNNEPVAGAVTRFIPSVEAYTAGIESATLCPVPIWSATWNKWDWALLILAGGAGILLLRFLTRYLSFLQIRRKAQLVSSGDVSIYQVDRDIIPFSFGNSIFVNRRLHKEQELQEIIRHEFVHVKQKHTRDIIWSELLCILNWYNPAAWLIRRSIRQNLEFIADQQVVSSGLDRKQYQYLLLKVIGNKHFSIANQFNFSSLKKRIAMMNRIKSTRPHLLKFFFLVPVLAILLLAFRNADLKQPQVDDAKAAITAPGFTDTIPETLYNPKGYHITIKDKKGTCIVVVRDKTKKEVIWMPLTKWNDNKVYYEDLYGSILPAPPPPPLPLPPSKAPLPPAPPELLSHVKSISINDSQASVQLQNGEKEEYDLTDAVQKAAFEEKYGAIPPPPSAPPQPAPPTPPGVSVNNRVPAVSTIVSAVPVNVRVEKFNAVSVTGSFSAHATGVKIFSAQPVTVTTQGATTINATIATPALTISAVPVISTQITTE